MQIKCKNAEADRHAYDVTCLIYYCGFLYSGADDGKIMKWNDALQKQSEVVAHESSLYSLTAIKETIYSCSNDGTIKSWTLDLKAKETLASEGCEFWKLATDGTVLYTGDDHGVIRTFLDDKPKGCYVLLEPVKDMVVDNQMVYIAKDSDVVITELNDGIPAPKCNYVNRKAIPGRAPICTIGDKLMFADSSAKGFLVHHLSSDMDFKEVTAVKDAHEMIINAIVGRIVDGNILAYTGGWNKEIKEWAIAENSFKNRDSCLVDIVISAMTINGKHLFVGGTDGCIVRVDF